ncbi:uncharacterized protein ACRADG_010075 [Cochliomyia hominivorax]
MWLKFVLSFILINQMKSEEIKLPDDKFIIEYKIIELVSTIERQYDIQTILIKYDGSVENCAEMDVYLKHFRSSIIIENLRKKWFIKDSINTANLLCIVCLKRLTDDFSIELEPYFDTVRHVRGTKLILYNNHNESVKHLTKLENFFKHCWELKTLNVLGIFRDFAETSHLHSYKPFPKFTMEMKMKNSSEVLFPNRVDNLMGHDFFTLPDQVVPRTFLTITKDGQIKLSGYVGHFINLLAERLNATLKFPFPIKKGQVQFYGHLEKLTWNYTIDLPGTLTPIIDARQALHYSYPFEMINACLMVPLAKSMPLKKVFFYFINLQLICVSITNLYLFTFLLNFKRLRFFRRRPKGKKNHHMTLTDYVLNDVALRGILGQPFKVWLKAGFFTKYIYILLSLTGLYLSLIYSAFLQTFFTRPFKEQQAKTFEDLNNNNIYVLLSDREVNYFSDAQKNLKVHHRITSYEEYNKLKSSFNTSYAYPYIDIHWNSLYSHQQNVLKNNLFMFSKDACLFSTHMLSFPLADNSIYRDHVQTLLMFVRDYGFINHWLSTNFPDDVSNNNNISISNFQNAEIPYGQALKVKDFELVLVLYIGLMILAVMVFLMERIFYRYKRWMVKSRKSNCEILFKK